MKRNILLALSGCVAAGNAAAAGLDETINELVAPIVNPFVGMIFSTIPFPFTDVQVPWIVLWLVIAAVFFTAYLGFINLRGFKHAVELVSGKYTDPKAKDEARFLTSRHWLPHFPVRLAWVISRVSPLLFLSVEPVQHSG